MRVLLAEDFAALRKTLSQGLREAGYAVDTAAEGRTALWYGQTNEYDAVVLDLMLPQIDGMAVLRRWRNAGRRMPVLILTAKDAVADRIVGLDTGADDYLVKPFDFNELLARLRSLVRRRYDQPTRTLTVGELTLDTAVRRVWRGEEEVELTNREFGLLEYLAARAGQVVSRTDIWEHLYEFQSETVSNVVNVYIGYLRRKLDRPGTPSVIRTVRGAGYVMDNGGG